MPTARQAPKPVPNATPERKVHTDRVSVIAARGMMPWARSLSHALGVQNRYRYPVRPRVALPRSVNDPDTLFAILAAGDRSECHAPYDPRRWYYVVKCHHCGFPIRTDEDNSQGFGPEIYRPYTCKTLECVACPNQGSYQLADTRQYQMPSEAPPACGSPDLSVERLGFLWPQKRAALAQGVQGGKLNGSLVVAGPLPVAPNATLGRPIVYLSQRWRSDTKRTMCAVPNGRCPRCRLPLLRLPAFDAPAQFLRLLRAQEKPRAPLDSAG